ncbi:PE family protein [Mycobacterium bourgelatii]|nr:PE family protein [Mycobacterium bourgelatii]
MRTRTVHRLGGSGLSLLVAAPELLTSAAADLAGIEAALHSAQRAAAGPTTGLMAAAADEVSAAAAAFFAEYGQQYQALSAQASVFHERFVQALAAGAGSYLAAEEAGSAVLRQMLDGFRSGLNARSEALLGRPLINTAGAAIQGGAEAVVGTGGTGGIGEAINYVSQFLRRQLSIYDFRDWRGWLAFVLDYTWGAPGTLMGYGLQIVNDFTPNSNYDPVLSQLAGAHVYRGGIGIPGFATTLGNVTTSLGYSPGAENLMINHEGVHVWQNRLFGPFFSSSYAGWMSGGFFVGTGYWLLHPEHNWYSLVETASYYNNPWEVMAYTLQGNWPPSNANPALLWPSSADPVIFWPGWAKLFEPFL